MRLQHVQKRNGFTLIELLVVIAILALLMALTLGVMSKVFVYLDETKVTSDVTRLAESCNLFKAQFGRYPPGKIILCESALAYNNIISGGVAPPTGYTLPQFQALAVYSTEYLSSIFPGIQFGKAEDPFESLQFPQMVQGCITDFGSRQSYQFKGFQPLQMSDAGVINLRNL